MPYAFKTPTPLDYFASLVQQDAHFPLLEAALCLAQYEDPHVDVQAALSEVDRLVARLQRRLAPDAPTLQRVEVLNRFFFRDLGFGGNVNHYDDPDNSHLHVVLRTRRGIPISLAVLWLELAQGVGLKARGINFPGHFLVKVAVPQGQVVIDPFTGQSQTRDDLAQRLAPFRRRQGWAEEDEVPVGLYLQAATPREILARMLRNLKTLYVQQADWTRALAVQDRLVLVQPDAWDERRDRGLTLAELGMVQGAIEELSLYLAHTDDAPDLDEVAQRLAALRQQR